LKKHRQKKEKKVVDPVTAKRNQLEKEISLLLMAQRPREEVAIKARELYESRVDVDPVYAAYRIGRIYEELRDTDNAKRYYQEAIGHGKKDYFYHEAAEKKLSSLKKSNL